MIILLPPGSWASLTVGLPTHHPTDGSDPDGVSTFRTHEQRPGGGALYTPGTTVLTQAGHDHQPASAASQQHVPAPRHDDPSERGSASRGINEGSSHSPVRSSPRLWPPDGAGTLGLFLGLRTPPLPATHAKDGDRPSSTDLKHALRHRPSLQSCGFTRCVRPRVALVKVVMAGWPPRGVEIPPCTVRQSSLWDGDFATAAACADRSWLPTVAAKQQACGSRGVTKHRPVDYLRRTAIAACQTIDRLDR